MEVQAWQGGGEVGGVFAAAAGDFEQAAGGGGEAAQDGQDGVAVAQGGRGVVAGVGHGGICPGLGAAVNRRELREWAMDEAEREMRRLLDIMAALRAPVAGCPWDVQQDFDSIAPYTIEEAYEVADAIARRDFAALPDELGDLLFQKRWK